MIPIHILLELEEMLDLPWLMALQVTGGLFVARQSSLQQWCSTDSVALTPVVLAGSCCSTHGKSAALVYFILARFPSVLAAVFSCTAAPSSLRPCLVSLEILSFFSLSITLIFSRLYRVLNIDKKNN
jgi:hypothetical protein